MVTEEMKILVSEPVEEKLSEILGDPDADRELKEEVVSRLKASFESESKGETGTPAADFARKIGLQWYMVYQATFRPESEQDFERLDPQIAQRVLGKIKWLSEN
jgi:hypothetical protein